LNLPPMGLPVPVITAPPPARTAPDAGAVEGWMVHLQRAQTARPLPRDQAAKDESCGVPLAPPEPPPRAALQPPAPAAPEESLPRPHTSEPEAPRASLRVHVQHEPSEGLKVWLGIDGHAALVTQRATAAVADLRRSVHGERIAEVVCNGVPVYTRATPSIQPSLLKDSP
jgi:hypothetical protein